MAKVSPSAQSILADAIRDAVARVDKGKGDASDFQVIATHVDRLPVAVQDRLRFTLKQQQKRLRQQLKEGEKDKSPTALAQHRADDRARAQVARDSYPRAQEALAALTKANQERSLEKLSKEVESGRIIAPLGKRPDSQARWQPDTDKAGFAKRTITRPDGTSFDDRPRSFERIKAVEHKRTLAKAVGLKLQDWGVPGRVRSQVAGQVTDAAMKLAKDSNADLGDLSSEMKAAASAYSVVIKATDEGRPVEPEQWREVQEAVVEAALMAGPDIASGREAPGSFGMGL